MVLNRNMGQFHAHMIRQRLQGRNRQRSGSLCGFLVLLLLPLSSSILYTTLLFSATNVMLFCHGFGSESVPRGSRLKRGAFLRIEKHRTGKQSTWFAGHRNRFQAGPHFMLSEDKFISGFSSRASRISLPISTSSKRLTDSRLFMSSSEPAKKSESSSASSTSDEDLEWKALVAAFRMYKAAYGNLKVPQRFIVPNMKPWPKIAWGMRLGKLVQNIRATGRFVQGEDPERRQILDDLGFLWQVRAPKRQSLESGGMISLDQVYTALATYAEENDGDINVPRAFVVPSIDPWPESVRELPLGRELLSLVPKALEQPDNRVWKQKFADLGFTPYAKATPVPPPPPPPSPTPPTVVSDISVSEPPIQDGSSAEPREVMTANDVRFQKVYQALKAYRDLNGDLLVPQPFVVPDASPDWPEGTWGMRLGARVNAIRSQGTFVNKNPERRQMLDDLGFAWNPPRSEIRRGRRKASDIEAGAGAGAPSTVGMSADSPAKDGENDDDELSSLFDQAFDRKEYDESGADRPKPTWGFEGGGDLQELARQQAQMERKEEEYVPPRTFEESLDEARARAKEVGIVESITANNRVVKGKREKNIPWFNDDFGDDFVFDDVLEALTLYKSFYDDFSNLTVNFDFVVPLPKVQTGFLGDDDDMMSFDVDASARAARAIAKFEEQGDFDSSEDLIAAEIKRLQQEVGAEELQESPADLLTRTALDEKAEWPEHLAGMQLGPIVSRIRDGSLEVKHLEERKAKLDALDFDWGDDKYFLDVPFEKAMCAMYAYYLVRGDMFVYEDFVMPDEDPWPAALAGYEVGKAVKRLRELQNFMEAYHAEKVSLLRMIDFIWFPTTALPIDPNELTMDNELLKLTAFGHPDYAKMIDVPFGMPDDVIEEGIQFETDDPKQWWRRWHNWDNVKDYWYELGRRDNAFVLRQMDYPIMADEHEAKYGPGLFSQIEWTMAPLREDNSLSFKSYDEKKELLRTLHYYRQELTDCSDIGPLELEALVDEIEENISEIMKDSNLDFSLEEEEEEDEDGEQADDDDETEEGSEEDEDEGDDYDFIEEDDLDVEGELEFR